MNYKKEDLPNLVGREFRDPKVDIVAELIGSTKREVCCLLFGEMQVVSLDDFALEYTELLPEIPEGFTRWFGGECPVDGDAVIQIVNPDGKMSDGHARLWDWQDRVVAYRIIEQEKSKTMDVSEYWQAIYEAFWQRFIGSSFYESREEAEKEEGRDPRVIGYKQVASNILEFVR